MNTDDYKRIPKALPEYHDRLLFHLAYPANKTEYRNASAAIKHIGKTVKEKISAGSSGFIRVFTGSGLAGSEITASFSFALTQWLANTFPGDTEIDSSNADSESIRLLFREILPRTEYENIFSGELNLQARIKKLKGRKKESLLSWLIRQMDESLLKERDKESVFHNLKIFTLWRIVHPQLNRTSLQIPVSSVYYHKSIQRKPVLKNILKKQLPLPAKLNSSEKAHLINTARCTLAFLFRETEPFTYADINEITLFRLERGLCIALFGMNLERRLSLESYIGYLVFKNGIPVAYGGGWIFGQRCQFGINILPSFRGGESAFIFCQLLRVYHQFYDANLFVVKPYQFGKNNNEAIRSGAFWFYYKAGFRPERKDLNNLAKEEWKKKTLNTGYRSAASILKKLTGCNLVLPVKENAFPRYDASDLSKCITSYINDTFNGSRKAAMNVCLHKTKKQLGITSLSAWTQYEKRALAEWSLLVQSHLRPEKWTVVERKQFIKLVRLKGCIGERNFILHLQRCPSFWNDLRQVLKAEDE